jgi:hypothetical protein
VVENRVGSAYRLSILRPSDRRASGAARSWRVRSFRSAYRSNGSFDARGVISPKVPPAATMRAAKRKPWHSGSPPLLADLTEPLDGFTTRRLTVLRVYLGFGLLPILWAVPFRAASGFPKLIGSFPDAALTLRCILYRAALRHGHYSSRESAKRSRRSSVRCNAFQSRPRLSETLPSVPGPLRARPHPKRIRSFERP